MYWIKNKSVIFIMIVYLGILNVFFKKNKNKKIIKKINIYFIGFLIKKINIKCYLIKFCFYLSCLIIKIV